MFLQSVFVTTLVSHASYVSYVVSFIAYAYISWSAESHIGNHESTKNACQLRPLTPLSNACCSITKEISSLHDHEVSE